MNNLPNIKRKSGNVHSFLAFFTFHMLFIYKLLYTSARNEEYNIKRSERNGRKCF